MELMSIMAILIVFMAIESVGLVGILRGAGDTKFTMLLDIMCSWLISVPVGYLAGYIWKLPVVLVYLCLRSDVPVRVGALVWRIIKGDYVKDLTREL
jgi:Na+-driven multidrug efflux pump